MNSTTQLTPRWIQRLQNYTSALDQLQLAVKLAQTRALSNLEKQGLIQVFEFTHELAWKLMKNYLDYQGATLLNGSRDATRDAFQKGLISEGEIWMEMIKSRNHSLHTYNIETAEWIVEEIITSYVTEFEQFQTMMINLAKHEH